MRKDSLQVRCESIASDQILYDEDEIRAYLDGLHYVYSTCRQLLVWYISLVSNYKLDCIKAILNSLCFCAMGGTGLAQYFIGFWLKIISIGHRLYLSPA